MQTNHQPPPPTVLPLYTVADAAKALGVSLNYLYERIRATKITTVNLGSDDKPKLRIPANALQSFIDARTTAPVEGDAA